MDFGFGFGVGSAGIAGETPDPPSAPSSLTATANGENQIDLAWTDNADDETGFVVERSADGSTGWTEVGTPAADATAFSDTELEAGATWHYRVKAVNAGGSSSYSNTDSATTDAGADALLLESGDNLLLESGDLILLE